MSSHHPSELDTATDSVTSSPRSDHHPHNYLHTRVRFMCSFGGKIIPRPHDNQLRYVGGDTRIVAVHRATTFSAFLTKLSKLSGITNIRVKYQLPHEDLDALITVTTDEDVENMIEEYDRLVQNQNPSSARLRLFLFSKGDDSRASSINSLLDGSANRQHWFFDAMNGGDAASGSGLERGRSEASSIISEVPDYLFGLDNSDDNQHRDPKSKSRLGLHENFSASDPGSPAPVVSSPFCSTSSAPAMPSIPDLPPVKTKPDSPDLVVDAKQRKIECYPETVVQPVAQPTGYAGNPMWSCIPDSHYSGHTVQQMPVYYVPGPVPPGNAPVQSVPLRAQYVPQYPGQAGQIPFGYHQPIPAVGQVYGGAMRPVAAAMDPYAQSSRVVADGVNQQVYYGVNNPSMVQMYPGMVVSGGEETLHRTSSDINRMGHPSHLEDGLRKF